MAPLMLHDVYVSAPEPTGRPNARMRQTVGDMVRSMAVVLAVVAAILLVTWRPQPDPVREVPVEPVLLIAQTQASFDVLLPDQQGLRATSVRWEPTEESGGERVWHVGFVTPEEEYLQVSQSTAASPQFLLEQTANGEPVGSVSIDGQQWQQFSYDGRNSLVALDGGVTTVVSGTGSMQSVEQSAASLSIPNG